MTAERPLGTRAYGSIPHLPGSRTGPADRHVPAGQARICTERVRDRRDTVIVQEKLDGSCVAVARIGEDIVALGREGALAAESRNPSRRLWARFVAAQRGRFARALEPGERLVGEWLALAHGTRYDLPHEPFVCFDLMRGAKRAPLAVVQARAERVALPLPGLVHRGGAVGVSAALAALGTGFHGALDPVEGAIWRVERRRGSEIEVDIVAKYVRLDKVDGCLLPENSGQPAIWNWRPPDSEQPHEAWARSGQTGGSGGGPAPGEIA